MVVVASAEPNVPVTCCAEIALPPPKKVATASAPKVSFRIPAIEFILCFLTSNSWVGVRQRAVNAGPHRPTTEKIRPRCIEVRPHSTVRQVLQSLVRQHRPNQPINELLTTSERGQWWKSQVGRQTRAGMSTLVV